MSTFIITADTLEPTEHVDAIYHFSAQKNVPGLIVQYGSERSLAEANLSAYTENRDLTYLLFENGKRVARSMWGLVVREDV